MVERGNDGCYIAVDVGGTKTAIALFSASDDSYTPLVSRRYSTADHDSIEPIVEDFLTRIEKRPPAISLCVAGVVTADRAQLTNLPWIIEKEHLQQLGFKSVRIANDMTAVAASLPRLGGEDIAWLQRGKGVSGTVAAVLAPGTGLGQGFLVDTGEEQIPIGGEGGHSGFAPASDEQVDLLDWFVKKYSYPVSYEMVCAGPSFADLYDFYKERGVEPDAGVLKKMQGVPDRTPIIVEAAIDSTCPLCQTVVQCFLAVLGREAANLVLKLYATRGLYLGGGIIPRLINRVSFAPFLQAFSQAGPMSQLVAAIPVMAIVRQDTALLGAAVLGRRGADASRS